MFYKYCNLEEALQKKDCGLMTFVMHCLGARSSSSSATTWQARNHSELHFHSLLNDHPLHAVRVITPFKVAPAKPSSRSLDHNWSPRCKTFCRYGCSDGLHIYYIVCSIIFVQIWPTFGRSLFMALTSLLIVLSTKIASTQPMFCASKAFRQCEQKSTRLLREM